MDFMASNSYRSACRRPWQKSMDSQEFGFASNLINSMEVAPADELFFKGQLLPLQMDPRLHLVQALSNCEQGPPRISYWSQDEEVFEYNSSWMGCEGAPCIENKTAAIASREIDSHCPLLEHPPSSEQGLQGELSMFSWCEGKELLSCRVEGDHNMGLDNKESIIMDHRPPLDQPPTCDQVDPRVTPRGGPRLSLWCKDEEVRGPWLSYWGKDEDISFNSCRMEGDVDVDIKGSMGNTMMDLRSSSFRSQNSGFWESGGDKDTGDSSSSSRDSNGSSQDSYFPNNTTLETPSCAMHSPHAKASFHILWKSLLKKASNKATSSSSPPISRMGYSENLSKYKDCSAHSLKEAKEAMLPWKPDSVTNVEKSTYKQKKKDKCKGILSGNDRSRSGFKSKSALCNAAEEDVIAHMSTVMSKSLMSKGKGERDDEKEEMKRKQRSAAIKGRWQGYARRLRPLCEIKKGLMGQFRMDECGKRACEVESGNIYAARTPMQRRLSHQISLFESHKLIVQQQSQVYVHPHKGSNMLAMSSCPPSRTSSPNHSGVLAVIEPKHKRTATTSTTSTALQVAHGTKKINITEHASTNKFGISATHANKTVKANSNAFPSSNYSSMSTMQELHSALQSAIAHCKESNKRLDCPA